MGKFTGKTAFITGGASGIGRTTAMEFAREGANVVIVTSTIVDKAEALAQEVHARFGAGALGLRCDVREEADVEAAVAKTVETFGSLDFAFNNAGVGPDGGKTIPNAPLTDVTAHDWNWVLGVDLTGVFFCLKHELRRMQKQQGGVIVCTASTAGMKPMGGFGAYGPAKAGLIQLTKAAAVENKEFGIRCNVVCPGPTLGTGMADRLFGTEEEVKARMAEMKELPGGGPSFGHTIDIARAVLWLCSDEASRINGNCITVDGGMDIL